MPNDLVLQRLFSGEAIYELIKQFLAKPIQSTVSWCRASLFYWSRIALCYTLVPEGTLSVHLHLCNI